MRVFSLLETCTPSISSVLSYVDMWWLIPYSDFCVMWH